MRFFVSTCVLVACASLAPCAAFGTDYYVRTSGLDTNSGLSPATALKSVKHAAELAVSGDRIYVGAGSYADTITVDGILESSSITTFVADTTGTHTGDAGNVVISGLLAVVNSNYVQFHAFQFQGASRALVWKGSYAGLFQDCTFTAITEPLLIKDGEITFDDCQLADFADDGVYVDGEALVTLKDCTITGCGAEGIEISKAARVVLEGTTVNDNVGDGIRIEHLASTIDDGGVGAPKMPSGPRLVAAKDGIRASGGVFDGYDSGLGAYGPSNSSSNVDLYANNEISIAASVPVNGDVYHGPNGTASVPNMTGTIMQMPSDITMQPIDPGDAATNNNNANIPLTNMGANPLDASGNLIVPFGHILDLPAGTYYFNRFFVTGGTVRLAGATQVYVVGEFNSSGTITSPTNNPADFKVLAMGAAVTFTGSSPFYGAIYAPDARITVTGTVEVFGMAVANEIVTSGRGVHADVSLAGYAAAVQGSVGNSEPTPPGDWTPIADADLEVKTSTVNGNSRGVHMETGQNLVSLDSDYSSNTEWGLYLKGTFDLTDCTVDSNGTGGLWVNAVSDGEFKFTGLKLTDNVDYGIYLDNCDITFDGTWLNPALITGSNHVLAMSDGKLAISGLTISGGAVAGVLATGGDLTVTNATFSGNGYGVAVNSATAFVMDTCTVTQNSVGLYLNQNTTANVVNSDINNNTTWAATVYASAVTGAAVTFDACDVHHNTNGLGVLNATTGDVTLVDTDIRDNSKKGLHFSDCNLTLGDQATNAWQVLRNNYNISILRSTLTLADATVADGNSYGILCIDSDVTLTGCTVLGPYGVFADATNRDLAIDATRFESRNVAGWGIVRYGGNVSIKNSIFDSFWGGVYLKTGSDSDQATVLNCTIGNATTFGIYVAEGDATVQNSILTGDGAGTGLTRGNLATLTHSYNLLDKFNVPFDGTSADATELLKSPRFVDPASGDYHLDVGSPAINIGFDLGIQVGTDMEGNARPSFRAFEVGAYEYVDPHGSFRVLDWSEQR